MSQPAELPRRHRLTVDDYHRMGEIGIFAPDARLELIDGEVIDMPPIGSLHAATVNRLTRLLILAAGDHAVVLTQNPVLLDRYSQPQPDFALARPRTNFYEDGHPGPADLLLAVEVSDTSLHFDRDVKVGLYARHRIPEMWLIDVRGRKLVRHRTPHQGGYALVDEPNLSAPLEVAALPDVRIDLGTLFS